MKLQGLIKKMQISHRIFLSYFTSIYISDYLFVVDQVANGIEVNVTGYYGYRYVKTFTVVNTNATWLDAYHGCKSLSYGSIPTSTSDGFKFLHLRNHLFLNHPQTIGHPIWLGFLKPNLDGLWYTWGNCKDPLDKAFQSTFSNDDGNQRQCLLLNMTENARDMVNSWYAASCQEQHSFVCAAGAGIIEMTEYLGMDIQVWDSLTDRAIKTNITLQECMDMCMEQSSCFLLVFISNTATCQRYYRPLHDLPVEITLVSIGDNNTVSYVKSEENKIVIVDVPETDLTTSYSITDLPCYVENTETSTSEQEKLTTTENGEDASTTEKGNQVTSTCYGDQVTVQPEQQTTENGKSDSTTTQMGNKVTQKGVNAITIEESIKSIRKENIVDVKTLSSYKNKRISAKDSRPSARTFGIIGGLICILICSMIVLADIPKMITDWRKIHRSIKSNSDEEKINRMFIRTHFVPTKDNLRRRSSL